MSNFFVLRQPKATWEAEDTPAPGNYIGVESDIVNGTETETLRAKLFNGGAGTPWNDLPYWNPSGLPSNSEQGNVMYVAQSDSVRDAIDEFAASTSYTTLVFPSGATYTLSSTTLVDGLVNKTIVGNGATFFLTGLGTQYGLRLTGTWQNSSIQNLNFTGTGLGIQYGISVNTTGNILAYNNAMIQGCSFGGSLTYACKTEEGTSGATIENCRFNGTSFGSTGLWLAGEYSIATQNFIFGAPAGIYLTGGNNRVTNNTLATNRWGIVVQNAVPNSDHGQISNNTINHSTQVGIWIDGTTYSMDVFDNEIWATAGANFGAFGTSFGMFIQNAVNVNVKGNTFGRNQFSLGYQDLTRSNIQNNDFIGVFPTTTNHIKNFGGTNSQVTISDNCVDADVTVATVIDPEATMYSNRIAGNFNQYAVVAGDVTNNTATMANITGLTVPGLLAGRTYSGTVNIKCSNSTAAEGIAIDFDGSTCTATSFEAGAGILTGGTAVASNTVSSALATDLVWTTITGETWITITFTIKVNALGSLQLRFCEGTAHSSGTATVFKGSNFRLVDVTAQ